MSSKFPEINTNSDIFYFKIDKIFRTFFKRCRKVLGKTSVRRFLGRTSVGRKSIWRQKVSPNELKILEMVKHNK